MPNVFDLRHLYLRYREAIVSISVELSRTKNKGDKSIGTGFHIGDGLIVTARHIVENQIDAIRRQSDQIAINWEPKVFFPVDANIDIAVLKTDFEKIPPARAKQKHFTGIPQGVTPTKKPIFPLGSEG